MNTTAIVKAIYSLTILLFLGGIMYGTLGLYLVNKDYLYPEECDIVPETTEKYEAKF